MANASVRIILVSEMDVIAYAEQHSFLLLFPWLALPSKHSGSGGHTPFLSPHSILMTARPSAPPNSTQGVFFPASSRWVAYGVRVFWRRDTAARGGQNG